MTGGYSLIANAVERLGVDCGFYRHGEDERYHSARAIEAGYGRSNDGVSIDDRGVETNVDRVLYVISPDAPPSARGGYLLVNGETLVVRRCELVGCGDISGFWRVVAEVSA